MEKTSATYTREILRKDCAEVVDGDAQQVGIMKTRLVQEWRENLRGRSEPRTARGKVETQFAPISLGSPLNSEWSVLLFLASVQLTGSDAA